MFKILQEQCTGCGVCADICPDGIVMNNGKATIKNPDADCLQEAAKACPHNVIVAMDSNASENRANTAPAQNSNPGQGMGRGMGQGKGMGRGQGAGKGRGMGLGPRDGRGKGQGGGGRR